MSLSMRCKHLSFVYTFRTNSSLTTGIDSGPVNKVHKNRIVTGHRTI